MTENKELSELYNIFNNTSNGFAALYDKVSEIEEGFPELVKEIYRELSEIQNPGTYREEAAGALEKLAATEEKMQRAYNNFNENKTLENYNEYESARKEWNEAFGKAEQYASHYSEDDLTKYTDATTRSDGVLWASTVVNRPVGNGGFWNLQSLHNIGGALTPTATVSINSDVSAWERINGVPVGVKFSDAKVTPDGEYQYYAIEDTVYLKDSNGNYYKTKGEKLASGASDFIPSGTITPFGTSTILSKHTGIIPANQTSNLFNLANIAPSIISEYTKLPKNVKFNDVYGNDSSTNVGTVKVNITSDGEFDIDSFTQQLSQIARLSKQF